MKPFAPPPEPRTRAQLLGYAQSLLDGRRVPQLTSVSVTVLDRLTGARASYTVERGADDDEGR